MPRTVSDAGHFVEPCLLRVYLFNELRHFFFSLVSGIAVTLLHQPDQLIKVTADPVKIVVGQFTPGLFDLTANLHPFTSQYISIESYVHHCLLHLIEINIRAKSPTRKTLLLFCRVVHYTIQKRGLL